MAVFVHVKRVLLLGGSSVLASELAAALGPDVQVKPVDSFVGAREALLRDDDARLVVVGASELDQKRWHSQLARVLFFDGEMRDGVRQLERMFCSPTPCVEALLLSVTSALGRSLGDDCVVTPCPFPSALPEREIALLSIAGPAEGGVLLMPEGDLVTRCASSAVSERVWDQDIAATATLLALAEEVRQVCLEYLVHGGSFQVASPVVIFGEGLSVRSGDNVQIAYRMDLSGASADGGRAALALAAWLGVGHARSTTTAERLASLDELRHELLARRGVG